jgi:hypothetical protein
MYVCLGSSLILLNACMYVIMYVCAYTPICMHAYNIYACISAYAYTRTLCMYVSMHAHTAFPYKHVHAYAHSSQHWNADTHRCVKTYIHTCYTHSDIHPIRERGHAFIHCQKYVRIYIHACVYWGKCACMHVQTQIQTTYSVNLRLHARARTYKYIHAHTNKMKILQTALHPTHT